MGAAALGSRLDARTKLFKKFASFARGTDTLSVAEKVYSIAGFLAIVTTFLLVMSVQTVRLQTSYRHMHATSAEAAINIGRINAMIYAIVMESRGIYMSSDHGAMKPFADALVRRNRELADAVKSMERTVGDDDAEQLASFSQRIAQFIDFRQELVRRGLEISPAAAREWGDNDANRTLRNKLNVDLEALERIIKIYERPMDGGGWVSVQEDVTEQRQRERMLERMERFLATIIENVTEGIIAKDARNQRYVFVNKAAEKMIGMSRGEIIGKTARELFSAEAAELIERRDLQLLAQKQQLEPIIDTIDNPTRGRRVISARRVQIGGAGEESHMFVTMVEDRTETMVAAA